MKILHKESYLVYQAREKKLRKLAHKAFTTQRKSRARHYPSDADGTNAKHVDVSRRGRHYLRAKGGQLTRVNNSNRERAEKLPTYNLS